METIVAKYPKVFKGICKVKSKSIHIFLKDNNRTLVQQKLKPVLLHLMEPIRMHLNKLLKGDVIERPLPSEDATGWVSNMVIESKKWDPSKIRLTLDTLMMDDFILQTHFPIQTSEQFESWISIMHFTRWNCIRNHRNCFF